MIDHLTKEILDTAYQGFPAGQGMIASDDRFLEKNSQTDTKAKEIYAKLAELKLIDDIDNKKFETEMLELNGRTFGCSNKSNVLLNKGAIFPELGLHLVCHEIMYSLASPIAVNELREINYGDEAINEFFARLATLIFNSMDEKKNPIIAGYTLWEGDLIYPHSNELGLYGSLMECDKWLQDSAWENPCESVEFCKKMANYYFLK